MCLVVAHLVHALEQLSPHGRRANGAPLARSPCPPGAEAISMSYGVYQIGLVMARSCEKYVASFGITSFNS
jgi:hypothetical protein